MINYRIKWKVIFQKEMKYNKSRNKFARNKKRVMNKILEDKTSS
jgi:hypothetical protein